MSTPMRLKFKDLSLRIDANFWHELETQKLHDWKLEEPDAACVLLLPSLKQRGEGWNAAKAATACTVTLLPEGLKQQQPPSTYAPNDDIVLGTLKNFNTLQQLVDLDKKQALVDAGRRVWATIFDPASPWNAPLPQDAAAAADGSVSYFSPVVAQLFTFADLKTHEFHYCAAFPAIDVESPVTIVAQTPLGNCDGDSSAMSAEAATTIWDFAVARTNGSSPPAGRPFVFLPSAKTIVPFHSTTVVQPGAIVVFADTALSGDYPGWGLRNVIAAMRLTHPQLVSMRFLALRSAIANSVLYDCACEPLAPDYIPSKRAANAFKTNGWVDTVIHTVAMGNVMDPERLAESSAKLNLSLMKWRMLPSLQLDGLQQCKALLLGSGTLGCNIARNLMMWGVTHITLVDRGNVSHSNPVRQSLFELSDVLAEGDERCKSIAAAKALKRILPTAQASGVKLTIRMPGHRVDPGAEAAAKEDIGALDALIQQHDVVFLLTDSRESRWLPTVLAALHDKPVINTALGFDTYVVMRHGVSLAAQQPNDGAAPAALPAPSSSNPAVVEEHRLGCYFCNDVVAPQDSLTARSLDQQCTVTRPGVSAIASALSVEMLAALYNHPRRFQAPPHREDRDEETSPVDPPTPLGVVPHQLRGNVYTYGLGSMYGRQYDKCTACSSVILDHVRRDGYDFIIQCLNNPLLMEEVTGLKAEKDAVAAKYADWDDDTAFDD